ncbi:hypothetical protein [Streptomyces sp. NBC_00019]|uniref:hypothetical protein n=1 Tax=Streptomyces sp. NBC_00019 TaxID=2975623 RepID=UPI00324DB564
MVDPSLAALALSAATTVVAAMATDSWNGARNRIARIFRHNGTQTAAEQTLDTNNTLVEQAEDADRTRELLAPQWQAQLEGLLGGHPEARGLPINNS